MSPATGTVSRRWWCHEIRSDNSTKWHRGWPNRAGRIIARDRDRDNMPIPRRADQDYHSRNLQKTMDRRASLRLRAFWRRMRPPEILRLRKPRPSPSCVRWVSTAGLTAFSSPLIRAPAIVGRVTLRDPAAEFPDGSSPTRVTDLPLHVRANFDHHFPPPNLSPKFRAEFPLKPLTKYNR